MTDAHDDPTFRQTSAGHGGSTTGWLDAHFETCQPEYEAMLRSAGIEPGWHVLDAGCGTGSFLPLLAELVGPTGQITALDLTQENIATVERRLAAWSLPCPIAVRAGSVLALPFPDDAFDAVWFANTTQYLTDAELATTLAEFRRVVRPGGLVAIKEQDGVAITHAPADPALMWRLFDAIRPTAAQIGGVLRARQLRFWLERAGFQGVQQRTTMIERWVPLRPVERQFIGSFYAACADGAAGLALPDADQAFWRNQRDPASPDHLINQPEFYYCEGNVLATGRVPRSSQ